jgi:hypothetical protein
MGHADIIGQPARRPPTVSFKEKTMPASEIEIHAIVRRLLREGYAALNAARRRVVDTLMAVC